MALYFTVIRFQSVPLNCIPVSSYLYAPRVAGNFYSTCTLIFSCNTHVAIVFPAKQKFCHVFIECSIFVKYVLRKASLASFDIIEIYKRNLTMLIIFVSIFLCCFLGTLCHFFFQYACHPILWVLSKLLFIFYN